MTKSLGKQNVLIRTTKANGSPVREITNRATVYERRDGTLFRKMDGIAAPIHRLDPPQHDCPFIEYEVLQADAALAFDELMMMSDQPEPTGEDIIQQSMAMLGMTRAEYDAMIKELATPKRRT